MVLVLLSLQSLTLLFLKFMFLLKLNFFSYSLSLIITLFKLALNYRPQSSSDDLDLLFDDLTSLNPTFLSNLILLGDFNINFYSTSSSKTKLDAISDTFDLKQIINAPTHFSHTNTPSTIDLVFLPSNIDGLLVVFFLLSFLQTISLFFSPFPLILLTVLPPPLLVRSGYTISLTLSMLMLSSAPLTEKNYSPCQIRMLPGPYLKNFSSAL